MTWESMPVTIGTSTTSVATQTPRQRKTFFANGYFWDFYSDGTNMVYRTSVDEINWSAATVVRACTDGEMFEVTYNPDYSTDYIYYVYGGGLVNNPLLFCRGTISGASIVWGTEFEVAAASLVLHYRYPTLAVLSDGRLYVGACRGASTNHRFYVWDNANNDGSGAWSGQNFADTASYDSTRHDRGILIPLYSSWLAYGMYLRDQSNDLIGKLWTLGSWSASETIASDCLESNFSATPKGILNTNDVRVGYTCLDPYLGKKYRLRIWGIGWQPAEIITSTTYDYGISICIDLSTGYVYAFWLSEANVLYAIRTASWGSVLTLTTGESPSYKSTINVFRHVTNNVIGVTWVKGTEPLCDVRYQSFSLIAPPMPKAGLHPSKVVPLILNE